ncbi:Fungal specific transcription factor domain family protein [Aspergillus niger]|uniref:Fungal specific transcription factor domain family protein n=1 Tax=Aspergillus niger TaxID=5061 RepID=A0A505IJL0_ASPNG|nr:Fungal specific transcription factor domain family protein [Aspergillus niger]
MAPGAESSKSQKGNPSIEDNSRTTNKEKSVHNVYKEEPSSSTPGSGSGSRQQTPNSPVASTSKNFDYLQVAYKEMPVVEKLLE